MAGVGSQHRAGFEIATPFKPASGAVASPALCADRRHDVRLVRHLMPERRHLVQQHCTRYRRSGRWYGCLITRYSRQSNQHIVIRPVLNLIIITLTLP